VTKSGALIYITLVKNGATTLSITTYSITTFSISIATLGIKGLYVTLSIKGLYVTLSISDIQHKNTSIMLSVVMLNVAIYL
jgi:hypothetical protein